MTAALRSRRRDLGNVALASITAAACLGIAFFFIVLQPRLPAAWRSPGSTELYILGAAGAALLLVPMAFVLAKRTGAGGAPPTWFIAHVVASLAGAVLVAIHSGGFLRRPPALLFLLLAALVAIGVWGRIRGAREMAATFATRQAGFEPADAARRDRFKSIIRAKRELLAHLDSGAIEGTFSPTLAHWLRSPRLALRYARLVRDENHLVGARATLGAAHRYWRLAHIALAYLFVLGLVIHVATVTFFAGYVADGAPITWWHLAAWGGPSP